MSLSNYLAQLWGIIIVVVSFILLFNPKRLRRLFAEAHNESLLFFWGIVTFAIGLVMVLIHNLWVLDWPVCITLLGWLTLVKGLDLLFFPGRMKRRWPKMKNWVWVLIFSLLLLCGLVLTYLGFAA